VRRGLQVNANVCLSGQTHSLAASKMILHGKQKDFRAEPTASRLIVSAKSRNSERQVVSGLLVTNLVQGQW